LLSRVHAECIAVPRAVRLVSFLSLTRQPPGAEVRFEAELSKPLRLGQLHAALYGRAQAAGERCAAQQAPASLPALHGEVLVVEDQPLNREVAVGVLSSLGLRAETASNGQEALDALAAKRFDLLLMDCEMPLMDGFAATAAIRLHEPPGSHLPIIALTADVTHTGRQACLAAGMDDHLPKPFSREALHAALSRWLPPRAPAAAALPASSVAAASTGAREQLLDPQTLNALRAMPPRGTRDMLSHIAERYLSDSRLLVTAIERAIEQADATELARAAHAWRSYNGNVGAHALAGLCRQLEEQARAGNLAGSRELLERLRVLHAQVRDALQLELRRSA